MTSVQYLRRSIQFALILAALISAASMWVYTERVLIAHQLRDAAITGRPRGNLSDLYPRWLGARELLLHGRNPYSSEVSREIQAGYYGRPLDASRPTDPKDQQGFVYPLYVAFYLAPTIHTPFSVVQRAFFWLLFTLTAVSVFLWLLFLRWTPPLSVQFSMLALTLGSLAATQGLKLQQLTLFVLPLVAASLLFLALDYQAFAGIFLALSTIKPQLVWLLLLCLLFWSAGDWRRRWRWLVSFLLSMIVLIEASDFVLPHWIPHFLQALREYLNYAGGVSVAEELIPTPWSWILKLLALIAALVISWRNRRAPARSDHFARMIGLALACTAFVSPAFAPYNQLLLLPALLILASQILWIWRQSRALRSLLIVTISLVGWPWLVSIVLAVLSLGISPERLESFWAVPLWTSIPLPIAVAGLMLVYTLRTSVGASSRPSKA